ncbi:RapGAP/RanGAP domain-containing protein [Tieghemostelium lacteum]|uniref:RapGAP/RanGAP domain-containing protein n=1 Tax=Tieghemostelium lacteum TaxID=361077 RepID=A0A152A1E2_TIELA|nr:RapGAP/RanGAP domain-containing protein [Tieghemostelium lacteum]|eukprot:KYQ99904.1 RapGAP/RanGAP domain-containing protein [Tieghemostelium lacteum]
MFSYCKGFRIEGVHDENPLWKDTIPPDPSIKHMPSLYRKHFYGVKHKTFMSYYSPLGPIVLSLKKDKNGFHALIYTEKGCEEVLAPTYTIARTWIRYMLFMKPTSSMVINSIRPELSNYKMIKVPTKDIEDELIKVYEPEFSRVMKVGVLYCKEQQYDETEMLLNIANTASPEYNEFLDWLGEKVELKGFEHYNGGLDTIYGHSGTHSIFSRYNDCEVMFHVSTMLPFIPTDTKQVERKKHLGNDRILIVFNDGRQPYMPNCLKSKQTHIIIHIQPVKGEVAHSSIAISTPISPTMDSNNNDSRMPKANISGDTDDSSVIPENGKPLTTTTPPSSDTKYLVSIANRVDVPLFGTGLPNPPIFKKDETFRKFLFDKMIAGATSLRNSPVFINKTQREKNLIFLNVINKYTRDIPELHV